VNPRRQRLTAGVALVALVVLAGCTATPEPAAPPPPPAPPPTADLDAAAQGLPTMWRDARSAAMRVATLPAVRDPRVRLEIGLQAALARAAAVGAAGTRVGVHLARAPAHLPLAADELALRILAALHETGRQWRIADATTPLAVTLDITSRATAVAEAGATLRVDAHGRSRRWPVTATWDGAGWVVEVAGPIAEW
jgi:hypothetical protein